MWNDLVSVLSSSVARSSKHWDENYVRKARKTKQICLSQSWMSHLALDNKYSYCLYHKLPTWHSFHCLSSLAKRHPNSIDTKRVAEGRHMPQPSSGSQKDWRTDKRVARTISTLSSRNVTNSSASVSKEKNESEKFMPMLPWTKWPLQRT